MTKLSAAVIDGVRAAMRLHLLLPLYACLLLLGLLQTWPLWSAGSRALRNPLLGELAGGNFDTLVDLLLDNPAGLATAGTWAGVLLPLTLLGGLVYAFFAGGVLSAYTGTRSFWAGCRRFWWSFLALGGLLFVWLIQIVVLAAITAFAAGGPAALVVALVALGTLNVVGEYARALGVINDRRNPFVLLGSAARFCVRHIGGVLALTLLAALLYGLLVGIYTLLVRLLGASLLSIVVQQVLVFGTLWIKALRLALAARYIASTRRTEL